ncbi:hypothetical protein RMR16_021555 [Agrobacterium sp. rho-13.3]|uniref:hypothetical protein n=1 Tax=Agrobacterium sp. rho-13.3 TaxID=3072980 RepID=UPI002A101D6B|nr:hypothetical protein [Agrobacterium sp. rho-13.3]MDX8306495.1 hypothetical protein [Agrobacterium sp. rho-13.3]MDX8307174.1 hypothetical protein [Agrobacterium sp. rho-13.3]
MQPSENCHDGSPGSEAFGTQERHDKIDANRKSDGQTNEGFKHGLFPSKPVEGACVHGKQNQRASADGYEEDVEQFFILLLRQEKF